VTFIAVESIWADNTFAPLEGATVAFDAPGGERTELVSGADGKVTFDGIDWSQGTAAVTAYLQGYTLWSSVNLDESRLAQASLVDDAVPLYLMNTTPTAPETVTVSGTATGLQDTAHLLVVNAANVEVATTQWAGAGNGTFSVSVPSGEPFTLQAVETDADQTLPSGQGYDMPIYQWMYQSFSAVTTDTSGVVLDFQAHLATTQTADISVATPTRADSPVRTGVGVGLVCPSESYYCTGWSTHIDISADGNQFDDSLLWTEPAWAETPRTFVRVYDGNSEVSFRSVASWPTPGSIGTLPDTAEWITPAGGAGQHPLHEAIEWELFDEEVPAVSLRLLRGQSLVWIVEAGPNATTLTVPEPPSTVVPADVLGAQSRGYIVAGWPQAGTNLYEAYSVSDQIVMVP
jgi:hypothetical protein